MSWDNKPQRGFTFIEVMIVVVIIGLLAAAVTISTRHFVDKAKENRARTDLSTYKGAYFEQFSLRRLPTGAAVIIEHTFIRP